MPRSTTSHDDDFAQYVERIVAEMPAQVPLDPDGSRPLNAPWYRTTPAVTAVGAIAAAIVLIGVSAFLLVYHRDGSTPRGSNTRDHQPSSTASTPAPSASPSSESTASPAPASDTGTPSPGASTAEAPPPASTQYVPPPGPPTSASAAPNMSTQVTRPPDISVRPTHRPAFPGQS